MSFATQAALQASQRYLLVRVRPNRDITTALASAGGGVYTATFTYPISAVARNGTALTRTTANPPTVNDTFYHDEDAGTFKVKLASAPDSSTNLIIATYQLFFSSAEIGVTAGETPDGVSQTLRCWEPRIDNPPELQSSFENVTAGIFSIANGSIDLKNLDLALNQYFSDNDSFYQRDIDVWMAVDSTDAISRVYQGKVSGATLGPEKVTLSFFDNFTRLGSPCYMGDTSSEAIFKRESGSFPGIMAKDQYKPCRYVVGRSKYKTKMYISGAYNISVAPGPGYIFGSNQLDYQECEQAVLTSVSGTISGTTNRGPWAIARTSSDSFKTLSFGTITNAVLSKSAIDVGQTYLYQGNPRLLLQITTTGHNLEIGDSFTWSHASVNGGSTQYAVVMEIRDSSHPTQPNQVDCMVLSRSSAASTTTVTSGTFNTNQAPAITVYDPNGHVPYSSTGGPCPYFLCYGLDFTYTISTTSGGNKYMTITFVDNFEGNSRQNYDTNPYHLDMTPIDPARHIVAFRVSQATSGNPARHGTVLKSMLTAAGLSVDSTSVTNANTTLAQNASFTIPFQDEHDYSPYFAYAQRLLRSTLGFVKINPATQSAEYYLLTTPSSSDTVDQNVYGEEGVEIEIDYGDIATEVTAFNTHVPSDRFPYSVKTSSSARAQYLHGITKQTQFEHVLEDVTGRMASILTVQSTRKATYRFKVATKFLDGNIGDDLYLDSRYLLGSGTAKSLKIMALSKTTEDVSVEATDLGGI